MRNLRLTVTNKSWASRYFIRVFEKPPFQALALVHGLRKILDTLPAFESFFLSQFILSAQSKKKKKLVSVSPSSKFCHSKRKSIDLIKEKKSIEKPKAHNLFN